MKVLMISPTASGGHPSYVNEVLAGLVEQSGRDCQVELLAPVDLEDRVRHDAYVIHDVLPAYPQRGSNSAVVWRLRQLWHLVQTDRACLKWLKRRQDFSALHFQVLFWLTAPFLRGYRKLGVPLFFTIHNIRPHRYLLPQTLEDAISRWMWRQCDALFVHTERMRDEAAAFLGPRHPPIVVTPHGIGYTACRPTRVLTPPSTMVETLDGVSQPLSRPVGVPLVDRLAWKKVLFFGSIRRDKGLHVLLAALRDMDGYRLTIAGMPLEKKYWETEIQPIVATLRQMGRQVDVIEGFVPDEQIGPLVAAHSFVALPYTREFHAQSGVLHVAMEFETPVVASSVGGIQECVGRWGVGEVALPDNPGEFAAAVRRLYACDSPVLEKNLKAAREIPLWSQMAKITSETYKRVVAQ